MASTATTAKTKTTKQTKPKNTKTHPTYFEMIKDAIVTMKERSGSSQYAISKYIEEKHKAKNLPPNFKKLLLVQLRKLVGSGKLVKVKNSFKLSADQKKPAAKKAEPKKIAAKAKPMAKKGEKKTVKAKPKSKTTGGAAKSGMKKKGAMMGVKKTPMKGAKKPKTLKSPAKKMVGAKKARK